MADYTVKVHPDLTNMTTEGSMDTSILDGKSIQRTVHGVMVVKEGERKMVGRLKDGDQFNDYINQTRNYGDVKKNPVSAYVFSNSSYVNYIEDPMESVRYEANNLIAIIEDAGISYELFTDISEYTFADFPTTSKLLIPELEVDDLLPDLNSQAKSEIEKFVNNGGTLVTFAPDAGDILAVLNDIFSFSLTSSTVTEPIAITVDGDTLIPEQSATIPLNDSTDSVDTTSLPEGSVSIYEGDGTNETVVAMIPYGNGKIYILGWDFHDASPIGGEDGGWVALLQSILESN